MSILGKWNWLEDGVTKAGDIQLKPTGIITHECDWSGGRWEFTSSGQVTLEFNGQKFTM